MSILPSLTNPELDQRRKKRKDTNYKIGNEKDIMIELANIFFKKETYE